VLKIRLARRGSTHRPFYRVVVNDSSMTPDARNVEELGYYDPRKDPAVFELNVEKAEEWIRKGAVPSPRVRAFIKKAKAKAKVKSPTPTPTPAT
jgi:small subunit ribosomal protein S16